MGVRSIEVVSNAEVGIGPTKINPALDRILRFSNLEGENFICLNLRKYESSPGKMFFYELKTDSTCQLVRGYSSVLRALESQ